MVAESVYVDEKIEELKEQVAEINYTVERLEEYMKPVNSILEKLSEIFMELEDDEENLPDFIELLSKVGPKSKS